jgi:DNA-binding MarR family transcriptional regulator
MPRDPDVDDVAAALQMSIGLFVRQLRQMQAEGDLSLPEASALKRLDRSGPTSVTELAKSEQISVQSMGTTLAALEARGLVARHPHPSDAPFFRSPGPARERWATSTTPGPSSWPRPCRPASARRNFDS